MKGPGLKLDLDVRRLWKCPRTGETIRLSGNVASKSIQVEGEEVFMQLVEEKRSLYRDPYHFDYFELAEEEQSSSERAAAKARSVDDNQSTEITTPSEQPETEVSATKDETPETDPPPQQDQEVEKEVENKETETETETKEDDDDSFGGGLL
ncbi:hypothetical protein [uncultured Gimesia sp.]|uniref:hypothetical protein n=1 Tax=uncultured Gimesia sp. TaxID=1678688 RepID=UPI00263A1338|nr:hypothetical protein [uncultured Gimesia sp.]